MKFFSIIALCSIFVSASLYAASNSAESSNDQRIMVRGVCIFPFFDSIPDLPEPTKAWSFSDTYAAEFERYREHLQVYRAHARASMEDGIIPTHALIRRLARRNITIAHKNPTSCKERLQDPDEWVNNPLEGLAVKDSFKNDSEILSGYKDPFGEDIKILRVTREQCAQLLSVDCMQYLEEVKSPGTVLWIAMHGKHAHRRLSYYDSIGAQCMSSSRRWETERLFILSRGESSGACAEDEAPEVDRHQISARQSAALLSIMSVTGEAVVQKCKEEIIKEWLCAYAQENLGRLSASTEDCPIKPKVPKIGSGCVIF